jgi:hypothetical protein
MYVQYHGVFCVQYHCGHRTQYNKIKRKQCYSTSVRRLYSTRYDGIQPLSSASTNTIQISTLTQKTNSFINQQSQIRSSTTILLYYLQCCCNFWLATIFGREKESQSQAEGEWRIVEFCSLVQYFRRMDVQYTVRRYRTPFERINKHHTNKHLDAKNKLIHRPTMTNSIVNDNSIVLLTLLFQFLNGNDVW